MQKLDLRNALAKIRIFFKENERLPSLGEIAVMCKYASRNAAVYLVSKLIENGFLAKDKKGRLISTSLFHQRVKLLGAVAAGFPMPEEEELRKSISLDEFLIAKPTATYMLEVKGDSMLQAGIQPGDFVLVEKGASPKQGDIVIAQIDQEWTLKYYNKRQGKVCLQAANPSYPDIYPQTELYIAGVVRSSCRKYG